MEEKEQSEIAIKDALLSAQKLGENILKEAQIKAESIISEASSQAENILEQATSQASSLVKNTNHKLDYEQVYLNKLQGEVSAFKTRLLAIYKSHLELISSIPEIDVEKVIENEKNTDEEPLDNTQIENEVKTEALSEILEEQTEEIDSEETDDNKNSSKIFDKKKFENLQFGQDFDIYS